MFTIRLKVARRIIGFAQALPMLKPSDHHAAAMTARRVLAQGYTITNLDKQVRTGFHEVSYEKLHTALCKLSVADLPAVKVA